MKFESKFIIFLFIEYVLECHNYTWEHMFAKALQKMSKSEINFSWINQKKKNQSKKKEKLQVHNFYQ